MKNLFSLILVISISSSLVFSQSAEDTLMPVAQIQKKITSKRTLIGGTLSFYAGKTVDYQHVERFIHFKYEKILPNYPPEIYHGYILQNEFYKLEKAVSNLQKYVPLVQQYPDKYKATYFFVFDDGTRIGFNKSGKLIRWYIQLEGMRIPLSSPEKLQQILNDCINEAQKL